MEIRNPRFWNCFGYINFFLCSTLFVMLWNWRTHNFGLKQCITYLMNKIMAISIVDPNLQQLWASQKESAPLIWFLLNVCTNSSMYAEQKYTASPSLIWSCLKFSREFPPLPSSTLQNTPNQWNFTLFCIAKALWCQSSSTHETGSLQALNKSSMALFYLWKTIRFRDSTLPWPHNRTRKIFKIRELLLYPC